MFMKLTLKSLLIVFVSLFISQESIKARDCYGKVIGGPLSGKENIQISDLIIGNRLEIFSLQNFDASNIYNLQEKWFDNYENLDFQFPTVNTVLIIDESDTVFKYQKNGITREFRGRPDIYLILKNKEKNEYLEFIDNGEYGGMYGIWPYLASDNKIYHIGFEKLRWDWKRGSFGETKCIFTDKHNNFILSSNGPRYFAYELSVDGSVYMWPKKFKYGDQRAINGNILRFTYYPVELKELGGSPPGFEYR